MSDRQPDIAQKDRSIREVLHALRASLGDHGFVIVDHWSSDLCAIGLASPGDPGRLVYVSSTDGTPGRYYVELEFPPSPGSELPYAPGPSRSGVELAELAELVEAHLRGGKP